MGALVRLELRRVLCDPVLLFFVAVLPLVCYLGFGLALPLDAIAGVDAALLRTALMVGLACYGTATAASTVTGQAAVERLQGWGRQLALTPAGDRGYVVAKLVVACVVSWLPVLLTFAAGALTGVRMAWWQWAACALLVAAGSLVWACYGLAVGLAGRSQSSLAIASGALVLFSFLGGVYIPLSGPVLQFARFTPLHGYVTLARWPVTGGRSALAGQAPECLWVALAGTLGWGVLFAVLALRQVRTSRSR